MIDDIVLFVYSEANYCDDSIKLKLGKITQVYSTKVQIKYFTSATSNTTEHLVERSYRDISLILSLEKNYTNSRNFFTETN